MFKFLINTVLLTALYVAMAMREDFDVHWGYVFIAALSALVCSLVSWLRPVSPRHAMSRDEAIRYGTEWPGPKGLRPMPPDGWMWMRSDLYKDPILVSKDGLITRGDWRDGF